MLWARGATIFNWIFSILAGYENINKYLDEFEILPDPTTDCRLAALEYLEKDNRLIMGEMFDWIFSEEDHKSLDEFEFWPDPTSDCGVRLPFLIQELTMYLRGRSDYIFKTPIFFSVMAEIFIVYTLWNSKTTNLIQKKKFSPTWKSSSVWSLSTYLLTRFSNITTSMNTHYSIYCVISDPFMSKCVVALRRNSPIIMTQRYIESS